MRGTTAIQANDLVFRKTLRDNGKAVRRLLTEIRTDMDDVASAGENLATVATAINEATKTAEAALDALLARANSPRDAASAGVDFTMLLGYLAGGWQMARAGAAAGRALAIGEGAPDFMRAKQATTETPIWPIVFRRLTSWRRKCGKVRTRWQQWTLTGCRQHVRPVGSDRGA